MGVISLGTASLSEMEEKFVEAYLQDPNARAAAEKAGYKPEAARVMGGRLRWRKHVMDAIEHAQQERARRLGITSDAVLRPLWEIAYADANDLVEHRRVNCRHCWGDMFNYQHTKAEQHRRRVKAGPSHFDPEGGEGYRAFRDPNPECPECGGLGEGRTVIKDTRKLTAAGRRLYAGIRMKANGGYDIHMHDRVAALVLLGKHLGLFREVKPTTRLLAGDVQGALREGDSSGG